MSQLILNQEQTAVIESEIHPVVERAMELVITNADEREAAKTDAEKIDMLKERMEFQFHPTANKVKAREVYEATLDTEKAFYEPLDTAKKIIRKKIQAYDTEEAIRVRKAAEEAERKRAQKEREEREARDAAIAAEEARILSEAQELQKKKEENEKLKQSAIEEGNSKVASVAAKEVIKIESKLESVQTSGEQRINDLRTQAETSGALFKGTPPPAPTKKLFWKAKVTNMMALCKSISEGLVPYNVIEIRQGDLNTFAKTYDGVSKIPGLAFNEEVNSKI